MTASQKSFFVFLSEDVSLIVGGFFPGDICIIGTSPDNCSETSPNELLNNGISKNIKGIKNNLYIALIGK
ncbi:MAG: hypothetical protein A3J72_07440 [Nitrospirae bacterium RIFCSPHIGHO2_02_FULL_40_19]|nr:MAG: hypothetical protein A3J72_07440 [Nitrospirae bacterium RIFCSPHIGHO2_02_FULL_40_19]